MKNTNLKKLLISSLSLGVLGSLGLVSGQAQAKHTRSYRPAIAKLSKQSKQFINVNKYLHWVHWYDDHHPHHFNGWKVRHINHYMKGLTKAEKKQLHHYLHITKKYSTLYYRTHRYEHRHMTERKSKEIHKAILRYEKESKKLYNEKHHAKRHARKHIKRHVARKTHKHNHLKAKKVNHIRKSHKTHKIAHHHSHKATSSTPAPNINVSDLGDGTSSTASSSDFLNNYFNEKDNAKSEDNFLNDINNPDFSETDGGKYYSWNHLKSIIKSNDFQLGVEPDSEANKVAKTIEHNINHYSKSQVGFLYDNYSVLTAASSKLGSVIMDGYNLNFDA